LIRRPDLGLCGAFIAPGACNGWYEVSTLKEPYRIEGKKTMGYDCGRNSRRAAGRVVYPTGGGVGLIGM